MNSENDFPGSGTHFLRRESRRIGKQTHRLGTDARLLGKETLRLRRQTLFLRTETHLLSTENVFLRTETRFLRTETRFLGSQTVFLSQQAASLGQQNEFVSPQNGPLSPESLSMRKQNAFMSQQTRSNDLNNRLETGRSQPELKDLEATMCSQAGGSQTEHHTVPDESAIGPTLNPVTVPKNVSQTMEGKMRDDWKSGAEISRCLPSPLLKTSPC